MFRCSSLVVDKCNSRLSCGSLSPIAPKLRNSRYNDVRIVVTDSYNNNSVFLNNNDIEAEVGTETHKFHTALESSLVSRLLAQSSDRSTSPSKAE